MLAEKEPKKSSLLKSRKLIKSISERFIEEYSLKISQNKPQLNKISSSRIHKSSVSPLTKNHISNLNLSALTSQQNFSKKKINYRNRNHPILNNSKTSVSTSQSKIPGLNLSQTSNSRIRFPNGISTTKSSAEQQEKINMMKRNRNFIPNTRFLEINEEINQSTDFGFSKTNLNMNLSNFHIGPSSTTTSRKKKLRSVSSNENLNALTSNGSSSATSKASVYKAKHVPNNLNNKMLYYKKQIRLNSSMDNVLSAKKAGSASNTSLTKASTIFNKSLDAETISGKKGFECNNIEDPEEMHFAFVNMFQKKKLFYANLNRKFNCDYDTLVFQEDMLNNN